MRIIQIYKDWLLNYSGSHFGTKFCCLNFLLKLQRSVCGKLKLLNKNIHVSSLLVSSLREIVICQRYFRIAVILVQIILFAPSLVVRRCTLCYV